MRRHAQKPDKDPRKPFPNGLSGYGTKRRMTRVEARENVETTAGAKGKTMNLLRKRRPVSLLRRTALGAGVPLGTTAEPFRELLRFLSSLMDSFSSEPEDLTLKRRVALSHSAGLVQSRLCRVGRQAQRLRRSSFFRFSRLCTSPKKSSLFLKSCRPSSVAKSECKKYSKTRPLRNVSFSGDSVNSKNRPDL